MAGPVAGLGLLFRQVSHSPAGKVWDTRAGLSCPLDCGWDVHAVAEHTLSPPAGTPSQHSSGSFFAPEHVGVSRAPSGHQALWVLAPGRRCRGCGASTRVIPLSGGWVPRGDYSCCAGIAQRGFALPPPWLSSPGTAQGCCKSLTSSSLPPLPASEGDSGGPQAEEISRGTRSTPHLYSPGLRWGFQMDQTTRRQHRAPAQPAVLCPQSITVTHKSPGPSQTKPAVTHWQQEHSSVLPMPIGGGVPPRWWPWHFSGEQKGHTALRAFLLHAPALLCNFRRTAFRSKTRVPRPWGSRQCQQLRELAALPVPVGTSLCAWRHEHGGTSTEAHAWPRTEYRDWGF